MRSLFSPLATLFSAAPADAPPDAPVYEAPRRVRIDGAFINHLSGLGMSIDKGQAALHKGTNLGLLGLSAGELVGEGRLFQ